MGLRRDAGSGRRPNRPPDRPRPLARNARTLEAYRIWATRAGSQAAAFTGDDAWTPERRFARAYERLALPGLHRDARFDLLVTLGRLGVYDMQAASLALGGANDVTVGAKRAFGIGDPLLLERRAGDLAQACGLSLEPLDLGLHNWQRGERATLGLGAEPDPELDSLGSIQAALRLLKRARLLSGLQLPVCVMRRTIVLSSLLLAAAILIATVASPAGARQVSPGRGGAALASDLLSADRAVLPDPD